MEYKDIFNHRGKHYHAAMRQWPQARRHEFANIVQRAAAQPGEVVCDLPAGGGYLADHFPQNSLISIETAEEFFREVSHNGKKHLCETLWDSPVEANSVDIAVSLAGIHHIEDKTLFYRELNRILKPGGRAVVADVFAGTDTAKWLNTFVHEHNTMGHDGIFLNKDTLSQLEAAGLEVVADEQVSYSWDFDTFSDLTQYCTLLFGIDKATPAEVEAGARKFLGVVESEEDPKVKMNWSLYFITLRKPLPPNPLS
eukprot:TRINITY_DN94461_c0_g1_i1.p1 TRINITY_DN94461_c0_g1~~TRINITY_DN94461_c0_g1_i1.p1  ORF type:complete len:254 (+),score=24.70 TRINITY_DN94461_c0_g1_i1:59-820(+)